MTQPDDPQELRRQMQHFLYAVSHDLQEPFRKVKTFGARLEGKLGDTIDPSARGDLERMLAAAQRGQEMIEGLLILSRIETHGAPSCPVDMNETAAAALAELGRTVDECGGQIAVGALPVVQGDPDQLRTLMEALLDNAVKFRRPDIPLAVHVTGDRGCGRGAPCRIIVADNGIGFDTAHAERIFTVFQRLHPRDVYPGLGLGLAIARAVARRHGGDISAEGLSGEGARFTVTLPGAP